MEIKHKDLKIEKEKAFENCKLGREPYAAILTTIVETYAEGMVLAIDNEWGTGKTTFVKMWQQYLEYREFRTVYFNAWENDFDSNALVAILSELKSLTNEGTKEIFKSVLHKGAVLAKNVAPGLVKVLTAGMVDWLVIQTALEDTAKGVTEILEKQVEEHANKKKTIKEFREVLEKFIKTEENQKPLVFFVDELDRCRPSYAVEVLEQLKHLFSVPGIVFVLSIDKGQLAHAVRGYYGSDQIKGEEYLRRFIDLEYSIPRPSADRFSEYLIDYFSYQDFFAAEGRKEIFEFRRDPRTFIQMATALFNHSRTTLRQQEKVFGLARLALGTVSERSYFYPHLFLYLVYLKVLHHQVYKQFQEGQLSLDDICKQFEADTGWDAMLHGELDRTFILASLLHAYHIQQTEAGRSLLMFIRPISNRGIPANISRIFENPSLSEAWNKLKGDFELSNVSLGYLMNKIDLIEPLKIQ